MKQLILTLVVLAFSWSATLAQNVGINSDGSSPNSSAMLDVKSTSKGFLAPRMSATERTGIGTPATGLLVYQTDGTAGFYYYDGTSWILLGQGGAGILPIANGGTNAATAADARTNLGLGTAAIANTGTASGNVPVLDGSGKIPAALLSVSGMAYQGSKDLSANPTVAVETSGNYYIISVAGSLAGTGLSFLSGDWMISNGTAWQKITNSAEVSSVAGKTGAVTLSGADITSGTVAIANGGTGQSTAAGAINALLPSQTSNSGKYLSTNGSSASWNALTSSQWTTTGSNIYYNTGNVGIGTTSPLAKLQVDGRVIINYTAAPGFYGQSSGVNKVYLGYDGAGTGLELYNFTSGKSLMIQDNGDLTYTGKVGIGTTAPAGVLQVNSSSTATDGKVIISSPSSNFSQFQIGNPSGTEASMLFIPGVTSFGNSPASSYGNSAIWSLGGGIWGIGATTFGIGNFGYGGSILNVKSTGNVGIGTATPSQKLDVAGNIKITNQSGAVATPDKIDLGTSYSNGATRDQCKIYLYDDGGIQRYGFGIGGNADIQYHSQEDHDFYVDNSKRFSVTNSGGANTSDRRLKRDILPLNKYGLQQVMQLNPVTYIFKDDSANTPQVGFIAQEVQQIIPEVVTGKEGDLSKGESLGIVYGNLVPVLTKAIQEQQAEIEALKAENAAMKAENTSMKAKVESIDNLKAENTSIKADLEALKSAVYGTAQTR